MWVKTKRLPHDGEGVDTDGAPEVAHCLFANCQPEDGALFEFGKFCNTPEGADLLFDRDSGIGYGNGYGEERPRRSTSGD